MPPLYSARIAVDPKPKPSVKVRCVGKIGMTYYPKEFQDYYADIGRQLPATDSTPIEGPVKVLVSFVVSRPKTTSLPVPKPDIDNFQKALFDAITHAGIWKDDSQVAKVEAEKRWTAPGEEPHIEIEICRP
jgi:Holliday junction resolvase RusA-like endonuclease